MNPVTLHLTINTGTAARRGDRTQIGRFLGFSSLDLPSAPRAHRACTARGPRADGVGWDVRRVSQVIRARVEWRIISISLVWGAGRCGAMGCLTRWRDRIRPGERPLRWPESSLRTTREPDEAASPPVAKMDGACRAGLAANVAERPSRASGPSGRSLQVSQDDVTPLASRLAASVASRTMGSV